MIIYSLIGREKQVLGEYSDYDGDFSNQARKILNKTKMSRTKQTIEKGEYRFIFMSDDDFSFLCLSNQEVETSLVSEYLDGLSEEFFIESQNKERWTINGQSQYSSISKLIRNQMDRFNKRGKEDKLYSVEQELEVVTDVARDNIDKLVERGMKLTDLVDKTTSLKKKAVNYSIKTRQLRRVLTNEHYKVYGYMFVVLLMLLIFLFMIKH